MADWKFLNVLQFSYGFKGTILDGLADKYLIFPTEDDCLKLCLEAYNILKTQYESQYGNDKELLKKVQTILGDEPKLGTFNPHSAGSYVTASQYDERNSRHMFAKIIYAYKQLQKIEDDILEKQLQELMKKELEEQKRLLRQKHEMDKCLLNRCPSCNK
jgi:hypothetical protein